MLGITDSSAQVVRDSVKIHFRQGYSLLEPDFGDNPRSLRRIADSLSVDMRDSIYVLRSIHISGGASPEGSVPLNKRLSEKRAGKLFTYLSQYAELPDSLMTFAYFGRDWGGLLRKVKADPAVPYREETIAFIEDIIERSKEGERESDNNVGRLSRLRGGAPYKYMYRTHFPDLRASQLTLTYERIWNPAKQAPLNMQAAAFAPQPIAPQRLQPLEVTPLPPFYMALKTNMLYDVALVPNIGAEFYLGRNWTVVGNWMYGWWKSDSAHWYWRAYGGDLAVRKWFGRKAAEKPLQGHHIGIYGQALTYDFETGGRGYMGGKPGGSLWDKANWGVGVEYGYSLPVGYRFNIDFTLGVGYLGGEYWEYKPVDKHYVWQATHQRNWFGPTKLEVSLAWLIGRGNYNVSKGGRR